MRTTPLILGIMGATLIPALATSAQAAEGRYYDPSNSGYRESNSGGNTTGYELFRTIGCPGKALLDAPCKVPKPVDSDGDGVVDSLDKCPNTPAGRKVNADGCELDSDGDGVVDGLDKCPNTPAGVKVDAKGCPLDSDGDGVPDYLDKCPNTPAGVKVDAQGCPPPPPPVAVPEPAPAPKELVLEGVNFDNDSAKLSAESNEVLDKAAVTLKEWGDVKVEVAGHTDSVGTDAYNVQLSDHRANTVKDYLISKGIDAARLTAKGYGELNPIADNNTAEGRAKNRRVELVPQK